MKFSKIVNTISVCVSVASAAIAIYKVVQAYRELSSEDQSWQTYAEDLRTYEDIENGYSEPKVEPKVLATEGFTIIGDEPGEVSRGSEEYRSIINEAYGESLINPDHTLTLFGKVHGLGARGFTVAGDNGEKGYVYDSAAIARLRKRLLEVEEETLRLTEFSQDIASVVEESLSADDEVLDTEDIEETEK